MDTPFVAFLSASRPKHPTRRELPMPARFWIMVEEQPDGCWRWTGSLNEDGYGKFRWGSVKLAHRIAWLLTHDEWPATDFDHLCRNRACVNPDSHHLEPVTNAENARRGAALRTHCPNGHPYDEENTRMEGNARRCIICRRQQIRDAMRRRRAA